MGGLVTHSASPSLDPVAAQPPGHRASSTQFTTSLHAFCFLARRASALAHDVATTARAQCPTTQRSACRDYCLWTCNGACPGSGFAGRLNDRTLDEARPRPGFSRREGPSAHFRTHVSDGSRFLPDTTSNVFLFPPLLPRPDVRSKEHASLFCLLASISLRITWVPHHQTSLRTKKWVRDESCFTRPTVLDQEGERPTLPFERKGVELLVYRPDIDHTIDHRR
jgi:hypothetical protein